MKQAAKSRRRAARSPRKAEVTLAPSPVRVRATNGHVGAFQVSLRPITQVTPYARNPRKNAGAVAKVAASIQEFGFRQPIVVDSDGVIVAGHTRFLAALHLGLRDVPVHVAEGLSPTQVKAYRIADNRVSEEATWDEELLGLEMSDLRALDYALGLTGFTDTELDALLNPTTEPDNTEAPWVGNIPEHPVTVEGDLIRMGRHRLLCGNSTDPLQVERLLDGASVQMVCTDPPYGISIVRNNGKIGSGGPFGGKNVGRIGTGNIVPTRVYPQVIGDDSADTAADAYRLCAGLEIPVLIFWGANHYAAEAGLPSSGCWLIWDKQNDGTNFADAEMAWTNVDGAVRMYRHLWNGMLRASERGPRMHPNQKPAALAHWCYERFGSEGDNVLDLFAGAGWTVLAAESTRRTCFALELSSAYCDVIVTRWEQATGQKAVRP